MTRQLSEQGLAKIKDWEGLRLEAYRDEAGVLTIGYGHTNGTGNLPIVRSGTTIKNEAEATEILLADLKPVIDRVEKLVSVSLTDNQFAALVAFELNTDGLATSNLLKKLNKGDYDSVPAELARWNKTTVKGKKVVSAGLTNRRAAEAGLWAAGAFVASGAVPAAPQEAPLATKENVTWGAGILATLATLFDGTGPVQWALGGVIVIAFTVGLALLLKKRFMPR